MTPAVCFYRVVVGKEITQGHIQIPPGVPDERLTAYCLHLLESMCLFSFPHGDLNMRITRGAEPQKAL